MSRLKTELFCMVHDTGDFESYISTHLLVFSRVISRAVLYQWDDRCNVMIMLAYGDVFVFD